jgi:hypothetical protein
MEQKVNIIRQLAEQYNKEEYFTGDPIIFPKHLKITIHFPLSLITNI